MKKTFLQYDRPLIVAMIQCLTPDACIAKIKASAEAGAEAYGIQLCRLQKQYRTREILTEIFSACGEKPIYVTAYRYGDSQNDTDEQCADLLLLALDCGATLLDVMGDLFDRSPEYELANDPQALQKQRDLIAEIHRRGGEVLMSSHTYRSLTVAENLMIARRQEAQGADILKIVDVAESDGELPKYVESIQKILAQTDRKLLFLVSKKARLLRYVGIGLGVCMALCVESYGELDTLAQPLLCDEIAVREHLVM